MASEPLQIPLDQLRQAFEVSLHHVEASAGSTVPLKHDYFWSVPGDELYDPYNRPGELTMGQLSESWQHLEDLLADQDRALGYHLVWLADVLRAIGQDIVRQRVRQPGSSA
ncbi:hypothetical protein HRW07_23300 [Streptomyces lunaelactis]|uniref:hypothetical protein n=1 Tax=Streptomyces lunaelactis TaxID=1535768 RepID=UPI001584D8E0|nr:hypothetical protein [Streptomyces lunaelactis]NUL06100.1 hypothetical protein [Streptomyces lunaelactis]